MTRATKRSHGRAWRLAALGALLVLLGASGCSGVFALALGVDEISPDDLSIAQQRREALTVIDTRDADSFAAGHIAGATWVPLVRLHSHAATKIPRGRRVIAVCYTGQASLTVAAILGGHGHRAQSLAGGMRAWVTRSYPVTKSRQTPTDSGSEAGLRMNSSHFHQVVSVISGLVLKPAYMILVALLIILLWPEKDRTLVLLRRALIAFELGEISCAVNFLVFGDASDTAELLHGFGMVVFGAYLTWALFLLLDERVLRFSDPKAGCAFNRFCQRCWKREQVSCGLQRLFLLLAPAFAVLALMPLSSPLHPLEVTTSIFGTDVTTHKTMLRLIVEARIYPIVAAELFVLTVFRLSQGKEKIAQAQQPFFWGLGLMSFSLFRYLLLMAYRKTPIWGEWWEEITEMLVVTFVAFLLWVFREQLGLTDRWRRLRLAAPLPEPKAKKIDEAAA